MSPRRQRLLNEARKGRAISAGKNEALLRRVVQSMTKGWDGRPTFGRAIKSRAMESAIAKAEELGKAQEGQKKLEDAIDKALSGDFSKVKELSK